MIVRISLLVLLGAGSLFAQNPVAEMYDHQVTLVENDVLSLAEAMPDDLYDSAPAEGDFEGVRTFGEQIRHIATMIYITAARVMEEESPFEPGTHNNGPDEVQSKEEVIAYLKDSLAYARRAMRSLTLQNHMDPVPSVFGPRPRPDIASGVAYHSFNHYGQMVVYGRMKGIVPPASVPTGDEGVR